MRMVVDGKFFYDGIEGFEYEAGYDYRLRIGKYDPWGGKEPPQDAGRYAYRLLEQLEKTRHYPPLQPCRWVRRG